MMISKSPYLLNCLRNDYLGISHGNMVCQKLLRFYFILLPALRINREYTSFTNCSQLVDSRHSTAMFGQGFVHQPRSSHSGVSLTEVKVTMAPGLCMDT